MVVQSFVHELNLLRVSKDMTTALTREGEALYDQQQRLRKVKEAISTLKLELPQLISALIEFKDRVGMDWREDDEAVALAQLNNAVSAKLPFSREELPSLFDYQGHRRAEWHPVAELIAERAIAIWGGLNKRKLGFGKETSPVVRLVAAALKRVGEGDHGGDTISRALGRRQKGTNRN